MTTAELRNRALQARRERLRNETRHELVEALEQSRTTRDQPELARCLHRLAKLDVADGHVAAAIGRYEEAVKIHLQRHDRRGLAEAILRLGEIHRDNDCQEVADMCHQEAVALYAAIPDAPPLEFAAALRSFALCKQKAGDFAAAVLLWQALGEIHASLAQDVEVCECEQRVESLRKTIAATRENSRPGDGENYLSENPAEPSNLYV